MKTIVKVGVNGYGSSKFVSDVLEKSDEISG